MFAFVFFPVIFSSCKNVVGMGDPIDWNPPILTLDPGPNPRYVGIKTVLTGTVTDDVAVGKVICRDITDSGKIYGTASISGNRWTMAMSFTEADNGRKIPVEIVAYDRMGNSGERSIQSINLIVDIHPPIFDELLLWRNAAGRTEPLESLNDLRALETTDPFGERSENADRYQNGTFWLRAEITENETSLKSIIINIYDADHDIEGREIYSETRDTNSNAYSPQWTIKETSLVAAANEKGLLVNGSTYAERLAKGGRIYMRVSVVATDMADNTKVWRDDLGYFCLYRDADTPKAILGGGMGQYVEVKTPLHVELFDDDSVKTAYTALLKKEIFDNVIPGSTDNKAIVEAIKNQLIADPGALKPGTVRDYRGEIISNRITKDTTVEFLMVDIDAGENDTDFGEYMLIGIAEDVKSAPHVAADPSTKPESIWGFYAYPITITDNSAPIIVIDTVDTSITTGHDAYDKDNHPGFDNAIPAASTGNSPEENTFPKLLALPPSPLPDGYVTPIPPFQVTEPGRYFTINGYTLRAKNEVTEVRVNVFRMAWIPYNNGTQDSYLDDVKNALRSNNNWSVLEGKGIQYWNLSDYTTTSESSYWTAGSNQLIGDIWYTKQAFFKRFDILGVNNDVNQSPAYDDLKGSGNGNYRNFYVNGVRENEPKLFVFYAKDEDGHEAFRTIRLLGNKTPPSLQVYDFTKRPELSGLNGYIPLNPDYSNINQETLYQRALYKSISGQGDSVSSIYGTGINPALGIAYFKDKISATDLAAAFEAYPTDQVHKLYVTAKEGDDRGIQIDGITMNDITNAAAGSGNVRGYYDSANRDLTYIAALPDILQRTFLFTAKNRLGVEVQIQRTVAVTSTSMMKGIITDKVSGTEYGSGVPITLQAQFSAPVIVSTTGKNGPVPLLNIRYQVPAGTANSVSDSKGNWIYTTVPFSGTIREDGTSAATLYLDFYWTVPAGAKGVLETIDVTNANPAEPDAEPYKNRAIALNGAKILDAERMQYEAFLPGYSLNDWNNGKHSLQGDGTAQYPGKQILLDGIEPVVRSFISQADGSKPAYTGPQLTGSNPNDPEPANHWYFKSGETIYFTLEASKNIRTSGNGNPRIKFQIRGNNNTVYPAAAYYYADFERPAGNSKMVFSRDVSPAAGTLEDGIVINVALDAEGGGGITDMLGNPLNTASLALPEGNRIVVDKAVPAIITAELRKQSTDGAVALDTGSVNKFNYQPILTMTAASATAEPWGTLVQYSLDNGTSWVNYPDTKTDWTDKSDGNLRIGSTRNGALWNLVTRQTDKAGNVSAASPVYRLDVNGVFPKLQSVSVRQPTGTYIKGPILFDLNFESPVKTTRIWGDTSNQAYIIVADRTMIPDSSVVLTDTNAKYWSKVYVTPKANTDTSSTLTFVWGTESDTYPFTGFPAITSNLNPITGKQMSNGITIVKIHLNGDVQDIYLNAGIDSYSTAPYVQSPTPNGITMYQAAPGNSDETYTINNINGAQIKVLTIPPALAETYPKSAEASATVFPGMPQGAGNTEAAVMGRDAVYSPDRKTITLIFDSDVRKEAGIINIKPHGNFPIPPVFPSIGYYDDDGTYVAGFFDVYNSSFIDDYAVAHNDNPSTKDLRNYLRATTFVTSTGTITTESAAVTDATGKLKTTGLDFGPYRLTTQGLVKGSGYAADPVTTGYDPSDDDKKTPAPTYTGTALAAAVGWNPVTGNDYLVPDTSSKYVLDYQYANTSTGTAVTNIRTALNAAHYRWRDIDVTSNQVRVNGNIVTIKLDTPLPEGLEWDLFYPKGTFVDIAGNPAPAIIEGQYWFWTEGVQTPVIRVDRKSMDYRADADRRCTDLKNPTYASSGLATISASFNDVSFRIESETPGAVIESATLKGGGVTPAAGEYANGGIAITSWSGSDSNFYIRDSNPLTSWHTVTTYGGVTAKSIKNGDTMGTWLLPNLLRRAVSGVAFGTSGLSYSVTGNGVTVLRTGTGSYGGLRSFNRDITFAELNALSLDASQKSPLNIKGPPLDQYKASKNYVAAKAFVTRGSYSAESEVGYEGIFKTIIALNAPFASNTQDSFNLSNGSRPQQIIGSNNLNPTPSIPGFPLMLQNTDGRYLKLPELGPSENSATRLVWISTEIVSPAYFQFCSPANNSSIFARAFNRTGDVGNYLGGSYGDLTYSYNLDRY